MKGIIQLQKSTANFTINAGFEQFVRVKRNTNLSEASIKYYQDGMRYAMAHLLGVPLANLFQHESSHMFGCDDDSVTTNCIMNALTGMVNRSYCKSNQNCDGIMKANCTRFD